MIITILGYNERKLVQDINKEDKPGLFRINQYVHRYDKQRIKSVLKEALETEHFDYSIYYDTD